MVDDKQDECTSPRRIYGRWKVVLFLLFLSTVVVILPLEILELVYRNKSPWINLYGSDDVGDADWCEAIDADLTQFIIEPWNSRSDYAFMLWGCFLLVLGICDALDNNDNDNEHILASCEEEDEEDEDEDEEEDEKTCQTVPNPLLRYPRITWVNGIFNLLHGLGSFWNHACECSNGGTADVSGMLAVTSFPLLYVPVQLLTFPWRRKPPLFNLILSLVPPIGQTLFFLLVWLDILPATETFTIVMGCTLAILPLSFIYLYRWRNNNKRPQREQHQYLHHRLRLCFFPLGLVCFFLGFAAWQLDVDGIWCFQTGILKVLQGHAVWHLFTALALVCVYWIYRSEQLTLVTSTVVVVDDQEEDPTPLPLPLSDV